MPKQTPAQNKPGPVPGVDLQDIFDNAPIGIFTSTPEGRFISANPGLARLYGYDSPEELIESVTDIATQVYADPDDRKEFIRLLNEHGEVASHECRILRRDGSVCWVSRNARVVRDQGGCIMAYQGFTTNITERKQAEKKLRVSEVTVRNKLKAILEPEIDLGVLELADIIDVPAVQSLLENFHRVTGMLSAIVDNNGKVLVGVGWQDICTKFHRCHPETLENCQESDTFLALGATPETFKSYLCKNGMIDMASPLVVAGRHMGNIYFGQFIYADEEPNVEQFRNQARLYGFDITEYLAALDRVPRYDRETVSRVLGFYSKLAGMISSLSFSTIKLSRALTKQQEAELELRESKAKLQAITDSAQDAIIMMGPDGEISYWNPMAESIFGYTAEEVIGKRLHSLLAPERYHEAFKYVFSEFQKTGSGNAVGKTIELTAHARDGRELPIALSLSAVLLRGNWHAVGIIRDITEQKTFEQKIMQAKDEAEAANQAKSEFLANMSHEIRTPINGIMGMMQLLETTTLDADQQQYVKLCTTSANRLTRLLSDILDLSRVEAGKMEIFASEFMVHELGDSVSDLFKVTARDKCVNLECAIDPDIPAQLIGDEARVRQVLFNLVGNALKFTQQGHVRLEMALLGTEDDVCNVLFTVSDTGIGIPDDKLDGLFKPFVQVDGSYTRSFQGAGLGLAIVKRLVDLMGGKISMKSAVGEGTTVRVLLPFKLPEGLSIPAEQESGHLAEAKRSLRILLAEDEPSNAMPIMKLLEKAGHTVTLAEDGQQVLDLYQGQDFDVILMDVQMPVLNGVEATRRIRVAEVHGSRIGEVHGSRFNGSAVEETAVDGVDVGAHRGAPDGVAPNAPSPDKITAPTVNREPLNREPLNREPLNREPLNREPLNREPLNREPLNREPSKIVNPDRRTPIIALTSYAMAGDREKFLKAGMDGYLAKPVRVKDLEMVLERIAGLKSQGAKNFAPGNGPPRHIDSPNKPPNGPPPATQHTEYV